MMDTMEEWAELLQVPQLVHGGFPSRLLHSLADQSQKNAVTCVPMAVTHSFLSLAEDSQSFPTTQL